jgi:uroporphyrinogen-III decarboxylase
MAGISIELTERERFIETLTFGRPDKVPFFPGGPRKSTLAAWHTQGLPQHCDWFEVLKKEIGLTHVPSHRVELPPVSLRMMPTFEEKVLEHKDGHYIVQDWMGNITEISDEYDYTYIRNAIDFVTRRWHKFPVETPDDFEQMKKRYNPHEPGRFADDFRARCRKLRDRKNVVGIGVNGPFWQMREWCGFEPLCTLFIDNPEFIREMVGFWTQFVSNVLTPLFEEGVLDYIHVSEDMAYKEKPMISPEMTREFLMPAYTRWIGEARQAGIRVIDMDSDGRIDMLIPVWIDAGFNTCDPIEVAAGNDINAMRRRFGRSMAYRGGVDKRCMAEGGKVIEAELARIAPVVNDGGYIPACDHGVPPDVSWPNFVHYSRLLAELTGWL